MFRRFVIAVALVAALLAPLGAEAAIAVVNSTGNNAASGSVSATLNVGAGNLLVVYCWDFNDTGSPTPTDSNNTFAQIDAGNQSASLHSSLSYAKNTAANASDVITCSPASSDSFIAIIAIQYSGADIATPLDAHVKNSPTGSTASPATSASFTTTASNEVIVVAAAVGGASGCSFTAGSIGSSAATLENTDGSGRAAMEDLVVSSIQSAITATLNFSVCSAVSSEEVLVATLGQAATAAAPARTLLGIGQ